MLVLPLIASADHAWGKYSWPTEGGPALSLGDNLTTTTWQDSLGTANTDWNVFDWINNTVDRGRAIPIDCVPEIGLVEICNWAYGVSGWLGIAGIWIAKGKQITRGYVKVNDTYFGAAPGTYTVDYNTLSWRQMVMCQEVGHIFGLAHQDEDFYNPNLGTCMDYTANPDGPPSNLHPNLHDYEQLTDIYGPGNGGGNSNRGGNNNGNGPPSAPPGQDISEWGKAISTDGKSRPDLFELDLGNGNKFSTHVIWAD